MRTVGLNFRDVLNVLGEYPGDPGPPGGDSAGIADGVGAQQHAPVGSAFGLAHAPLATAARAFRPFVVPKRSSCSQLR